MELRDYQKQLINDTYSHIRAGKKRIKVYMATGSGKTPYTAQIVAHALMKNKRTLIVVHRKKLVNQIASTIKRFCGHDAAMIAPGYDKDYSNPVLIAMAQTLDRRELPEDIDILMLDESHVNSYFAVFTRCLDKYCGKVWALGKTIVLGLTATPYRTKNLEGFCQYFEAAVKAPSPRQLIKQGWLTRERIFKYDLINTQAMKVKDGDFTAAELKRVCNEGYNKDVVAKFKQRCPKRKAIVFCSNVEQAKCLNQEFIDNGFTSDYVIAKHSESDREAKFAKFHKGDIQILVSVSTLTEGYDEPTIEAVVIARPTISIALIIQMIGRGLRKDESKEDCFILDFGGCIDHILKKGIKGRKVDDPIDIDYVRLCPFIPPKKSPMVKECEHCGEEMFQFATVCPHCGEEITKKAKDKPNITVFPDLVEFMTKDKIEEFRFIRKELNKCFEKNQSPASIFAKFAKKFQHLPPNDYFFGAVFGYQFNQLNMNVYYHYLKSKNIHPRMIDKFIDLEFGTYGKDYTLPHGLSYNRILRADKAFIPQDALGSNDIKTNYRAKAIDQANYKAYNYCYEYITRRR